MATAALSCCPLTTPLDAGGEGDGADLAAIRS